MTHSAPTTWARGRELFRRNRRRWIVAGILLGLYVGVQVTDWLLDTLLLDLPVFQSGPLKMTRSHFQQPKESLFTWTNFNRFLDNVTRGKPGILGWKSFYVVLILLYFVLAVVVFLRITEEPEIEARELSPMNPKAVDELPATGQQESD